MKTKLFALLIFLQALWMISTAAIQEYQLQTGQTITLETTPVDPRDYLRGDYMILRYKISSVALAKIQPVKTEEPPEGTTVYLQLEKTNGFYEVAQGSWSFIKGDSEHPVIRGKIADRWRRWDRKNQDAVVNVAFGLERFYVPEQTGNPLGKITVDASVSPSGTAVLKKVFVDGEPFPR